MELEEMIQREIEITIDNYLEKYKEEIEQDAELHIIMIKANLYIAINEKFNELRKQLNELIYN